MIKGNTIEFGYGDVSVSAITNNLVLQNIKPPQEVGTNLNGKDVEYIGDRIRMVLSYSEAIEMVELIKAYSWFKYKGYEFKFNQNEESKSVVIGCLQFIMKNLIFLMAA